MKCNNPIIVESFFAPYMRGGKWYSSYQRSEVAQLRKDGTVTVRRKTPAEFNKMLEEERRLRERAINSGLAIRDRLGRTIWKKR